MTIVRPTVVALLSMLVLAMPALAEDDEAAAADPLALFLEMDIFGSKQAGEDLERYRAACDDDDAEACANAGAISNDRLRGHYDPDDARIYYAKSTDGPRATRRASCGRKRAVN